MSDLSLWGLFLAVGLGTFAMRLSFVELYGRLRIPALLRRALLCTTPQFHQPPDQGNRHQQRQPGHLTPP